MTESLDTLSPEHLIQASTHIATRALLYPIYVMSGALFLCNATSEGIEKAKDGFMAPVEYVPDGELDLLWYFLPFYLWTGALVGIVLGSVKRLADMMRPGRWNALDYLFVGTISLASYPLCLLSCAIYAPYFELVGA